MEASKDPIVNYSSYDQLMGFFTGLSTTYAIKLLASEIRHWNIWMSKNNMSSLLSYKRPQPQAVQMYPASNFSPGSGRHAGKTEEPATRGHEFYW